MNRVDTSSTKLTSQTCGTSVQRLNVREIARRARVSTATVSRAINRIPTVDQYLARRVWKVVEDLGYYPNTQARALVSGHSRSLGVIVPELSNPFFAEIVQAFENVAVDHGYEILLSSIHESSCGMELVARRMIERRVDGVAALTFGMKESVMKDLLLHGIFLVTIDSESQIPGVNNIRIEYRDGIRQAVQHLAALRHERIAFVAGPEYLTCTQVRTRAFDEAMAEIGLKASREFVATGDHSAESGMKALRDLWSMSPRPTAILCSSDITAIGVLAQAYECGISVPHQLSVVGFDDIQLAQFTVPPLTTVRISQADLAMGAFQVLVSDGRTLTSSENDGHVVKTGLVLRHSTALRTVSESVE